MNDLTVVFAESAENDLIDSFLWGCRHWGIDAAVEWANDIRDMIEEQLPVFPLRFAIAPDDDGSGREYRQLLVGRYRVLFYIKGDIINVIHIIGSFTGPYDDEIGVD